MDVLQVPMENRVNSVKLRPRNGEDNTEPSRSGL
jgi:hypothetical protein